MGNLYVASPHASSAPYAPAEVLTGTAAKTVLQVTTAGTGIRPFGWGISFKGVSPTDPPGIVECFACTASTAATVTALTPDKWENPDAPASLCVGGTTATGYNATGEGTLTAYRALDVQEVHPQTGYSVWWIPGRHPSLNTAQHVRIRVTFSVSISCLPWLVWEEPS